MPWPHQRNPLLLFLLLAVLLFGGAGVGLLLAKYFAPGSTLAQFVGMFMLPLCLGVGLSAWFTVASTMVLGKLGHAALKSWSQREDGTQFEQRFRSNIAGFSPDRPPGTFVFLPVSAGISLTAATLMSIAARGHSSAILTFIVCFSCGLSYGVLLWRLARSGWLPLPEGS